MHLLYRPWAMAQKDKGVVGLFGCLKTGNLNGDLLAYLQSSRLSPKGQGTISSPPISWGSLQKPTWGWGDFGWLRSFDRILGFEGFWVDFGGWVVIGRWLQCRFSGILCFC